MKLAMCLEPEENEKWVQAKQMGLDHAAVVASPRPELPLWDYRTMAGLKSRFDAAGLDLQVIEGLVPMENIKLATPEREAELERFLQIVRNMGALGIPVLCYSWMAVMSWLRTSTTTRGRGGALVTSYDHALITRAPEAEHATRVTEAQLWDSFRYFLERAVPVAEKARVKLALHPDDPPLSPILGIGRIFRTIEAFDRAMAMIDSEANGITFCQANFSIMGGREAITRTIRHFGPRIAFVHFRDVRGTAEQFEETFHDEGPTDMFAAMRAYREIGFDGPIRPDHAPSMAGDPNLRPGYESRGRLFAIGYMKGLLEGVDAVMRQPAG